MNKGRYFHFDRNFDSPRQTNRRVVMGARQRLTAPVENNAPAFALLASLVAVTVFVVSFATF